MELEFDLNDLSPSDIHGLYITSYHILADLSDFKEDEIRVLKVKNPVHLRDMYKWDRILENNPNTQIRKLDYGINKQRELFVYTGERWRSITEKAPK